MEATKILLSEDELNLVLDSQWLLTKNRIIEKAKGMFGVLAAKLQEGVQHSALPRSVHLFSAKVFKGEYYEGLPYVMLDYPRVFSKDDVLAMRTMFWWGNFFSVTLHLKGMYVQQFGDALHRSKLLLAENEFYIGVGDDEWRHDFGSDNYRRVSVDETVFERVLAEHAFVKVAANVSLSRWNEAVALLAEKQELMLQVLMA
ncbi:MAG TPA: hypothetical protein VD996_14445 [Chitinophagaceae bacterium]|nr:hypothetical protein [Chitinophagaceae bacterium]